MTPVQLPEVPAPVAYAHPLAFETFKNAGHLGGVYAREWMWAEPGTGLDGVYTADQLRAYATEYGDAILAKVRTAIADYMQSEGCSCCRGDDHDEHKAVIAGLLGVAPYSDNSGFDFAPYRTGATQPEQNSER